MITWHDDRRVGFHRFQHDGNWVHISLDLYMMDPQVQVMCDELIAYMTPDEDSPVHHRCADCLNSVWLFQQLFNWQRQPKTRQLMEASILA